MAKSRATSHVRTLKPGSTAGVGDTVGDEDVGVAVGVFEGVSVAFGVSSGPVAVFGLVRCPLGPPVLCLPRLSVALPLPLPDSLPPALPDERVAVCLGVARSPPPGEEGVEVGVGVGVCCDSRQDGEFWTLYGSKWTFEMG